MIRSTRLIPILSLRRRAEDDAERAHAERVRALIAARDELERCIALESGAWDAFGLAGRAPVLSGWELRILGQLQAASHRRAMGAGADVYTAEQAADETRRLLVSANQERRTIERLHERAVEVERLAALRAEQGTLDELATIGHAWRARQAGHG